MITGASAPIGNALFLCPKHFMMGASWGTSVHRYPVSRHVNPIYAYRPMFNIIGDSLQFDTGDLQCL